MARTVTSRVALRPETHVRFRDFCGGAQLTADEAIDILLREHCTPGNEHAAGRAWRQRKEDKKEAKR